MSSFDNQQRNTDTPPKWRAYMHIAMGVVYIIFGVMVFYIKRFGSIDLSTPVVYMLSALLFVYGAFRIWRGFADIKHYNNQQ